MKKILLSAAVLVPVLALVVGGTIAFYNDTETSAGNIFTAGSVDLKVDHTKQTYNGVDCKTCDVTLVSDTSNTVVAKNGSPVAPYPAVFLSWIHPAWTAQNDPTLSAAGARWIWEHDPVRPEDTTTNAQYTFRREFTWMGPVTGSDLWFAVGSDNSVEVWLNGVKVGENSGEFGYRQGDMLHIPAVNITSNIIQGNNILEFKVTNWALPNGNPSNNPAGLIYKFQIDGNCGDAYFQNHCRLWQEKDLGQDDRFFSFDDVKPADWGTDVISLHVYGNDAYACLIASDKDDRENTIYDPETEAGDVTDPEGELSKYINVFTWEDGDADGAYDSGESPLGSGSLLSLSSIMSMDPSSQKFLTATTTKNIGLAWCAGTLGAEAGREFSCDGSSVDNDAQSDSFSATLTAYAEQVRNNGQFNCGQVQLSR